MTKPQISLTLYAHPTRPFTMDCQFSFGPNRSYFCKSQSSWAWSSGNTIPRQLESILVDPNHPQALKIAYDVAFPMEAGKFALCWKTVKGEDWYEDRFLGPPYAALAQFMKNVATKGGHTTRTVFGPGGSYFSMSSTGYSWQNIAPSLEADIHSCIKTRWPTTVALGAQGSYVVLYNDGTVTFDLRGQYPAVDVLIRNTQDTARRRGVMFIALNPYFPGEYFAAFGDGSASWNFPAAWSADVATVSRTLQPIPTVPAVPVSPAAPGGTGPAPATVAAMAPPVQVSTGGTAAATSPGTIGSSVIGSVGHVVQQVLAEEPSPAADSTTSNIIGSVGHVVQSLAEGSSPAAPAPTHSISSVGNIIHSYSAAPPPTSAVVSPTPTSAPSTGASVAASVGNVLLGLAGVQPQPQAQHTQTLTLQQGMELGLKAAQGINKIIDVFQQDDQQNDAPPAFSDTQNSFNFADVQAALNGGFDQQNINAFIAQQVADSFNTVTNTDPNNNWQSQ
ncbi:hypothetical protein B0H10DRAFT_2098329 [Mycena sp. CBHHK59/15]|nr:hypothetical protein B0H10DRAFT_2098329 [Mycena sp. CBHHK59/15]